MNGGCSGRGRGRDRSAQRSRRRLEPERVGARVYAATGRERNSLSSAHTRWAIHDGGGCGAVACAARGRVARCRHRSHTERERPTTASRFTAFRRRRWHPTSRGGRDWGRSASAAESKGPGRAAPRAGSPAAASPLPAAQGKASSDAQVHQAGQRFRCAAGAGGSCLTCDRGWIGHRRRNRHGNGWVRPRLGTWRRFRRRGWAGPTRLLRVLSATALPTDRPCPWMARHGRGAVVGACRWVGERRDAVALVGILGIGSGGDRSRPAQPFQSTTTRAAPRADRISLRTGDGSLSGGEG